MSEDKKKKSRMQRLGTGLLLAAVLLACLFVGGWLTAMLAVAALVLGLREVFAALKAGGHQPVQWPSFAALVVSVPLMLNHSAVAVSPVLMFFSLAVLLCVMVRKNPDLIDVLTSVLPLFTLVLPGICLFGILDTNPRELQLYLLLLTFAIPILGDTCAYFVGSSVGGPKLCPHISPNKTVSGCLGGLAGSVFAAVLVGRLFTWLVPTVAFPPLWADLLVGLLGGVAGQLGDLFFSMVKRHCKIKDFGTLFPGHGGMLDRLDSITFAAIIVYCFRLILLRA